jgi:cyclase
VRALLLAGADKVSFNSAAVADPTWWPQPPTGSAASASSGHRRQDRGARPVGDLHPRRPPPTGIDAVEFARTVAAKGAGEILLTSMDRDGTKGGYNLPLTRAIADAVDHPGDRLGRGRHAGPPGRRDHQGHASAVLAASIFHFGTYSPSARPRPIWPPPASP